MQTTQQLSTTLPNEMADVVKKKVRAGEYTTASEVTRIKNQFLQQSRYWLLK